MASDAAPSGCLDQNIWAARLCDPEAYGSLRQSGGRPGCLLGSIEGLSIVRSAARQTSHTHTHTLLRCWLQSGVGDANSGFCRRVEHRPPCLHQGINIPAKCAPSPQTFASLPLSVHVLLEIDFFFIFSFKNIPLLVELLLSSQEEAQRLSSGFK